MPTRRQGLLRAIPPKAATSWPVTRASLERLRERAVAIQIAQETMKAEVDTLRAALGIPADVPLNINIASSCLELPKDTTPPAAE